jgi:hypothetical protein
MRKRITAAVWLFVNAVFCFADTPFIGVWRTETGVFYRFAPDGSGGIASAAEGPFNNDFSFLVWSGTGDTPGYPRLNTLALVFGNPAELAADPSKARIDLYAYSMPDAAIQAETIRGENADGKVLALTRVSGVSAPLKLDNPLLGQWEARWNGENHGGARGTWSYWYREDGTVKTYHHRLHQFENAYLVRGNLLVIIGEWRFHPSLPVNTGVVSAQTANTLLVREAGGITWDYTRVKKARWK